MSSMGMYLQNEIEQIEHYVGITSVHTLHAGLESIRTSKNVVFRQIEIPKRRVQNSLENR